MSERIDSVRIDADEDGYHLLVSTDDGDHDLRLGDTDVVRQLIKEIDESGLRDWVADHDRELAAYLVASPAERSRGARPRARARRPRRVRGACRGDARGRRSGTEGRPREIRNVNGTSPPTDTAGDVIDESQVEYAWCWIACPHDPRAPTRRARPSPLTRTRPTSRIVYER